jgi:predicted nucleic acid-binding protein
LVDSNVVLDVLVERDPFCAASTVVWAMSEARTFDAFVSALSFANVYYVGRKTFGKERARLAIRAMMAAFIVAPVDSDTVAKALASDMSDFEDALQAFAGAAAGATHVVTRDANGFNGGPLIAIAPDRLTAMIAKT